MPPPVGAPKPPTVSAEKAWEMIESKLSSRYSSVRRAFFTLDADRDGFISMREFRKALETMG